MQSIYKIDNNNFLYLDEEVFKSLNRNYKTNLMSLNIDPNAPFVFKLTEQHIVDFLIKSLNFNLFTNTKFVITDKFLDLYFKNIAVDVDELPFSEQDPHTSEYLPDIIYETCDNTKFLEDFGA